MTQYGHMRVSDSDLDFTLRLLAGARQLNKAGLPLDDQR